VTWVDLGTAEFSFLRKNQEERSVHSLWHGASGASSQAKLSIQEERDKKGRREKGKNTARGKSSVPRIQRMHLTLGKKTSVNRMQGI